MGIRLYNSLTRRVEPLEPLAPPQVTFYMCGPTVWNYAHIGNFRTFLLADLLRRHLRARGYRVFHIMNLTDVDDRTIGAAAGAGVSLQAHVAPFVAAFFQDRDYLRIEPADVYPRATEFVGPMVALVEQLLERGLAYRGDDGSIYYAVARFEDYGRLAQLDKRDLQAGARVATDEYSKEDVRDFALWKRATPEDEAVGAAWDAPFGRGRPGWHLECSAMVLHEVGERFGVRTVDIHGGGVDLIFPHHQNEIAQAEGATGECFARCWIHGEFLFLQGTKMSKRFGNILTVRDLSEEGVDPAAVRMLMFSTHYRQQLSFSDDALAGAGEAVRRLGDFHDRLVDAAGQEPVQGEPPAPVREQEQAFLEALDDDLNAPEALGALFTLVRSVNRELDAGRWGPAEAAHALAAFGRAMAVVDLLPSPATLDPELRAWVEAQVARRQEARRAGEYATADAIRDELAGRGFEVEDGPSGSRWRYRPRGS